MSNIKKKPRLAADVDTSIMLGQSTNLLIGYQADAYGVPFQPSPKPALIEAPIDIKDPDVDARWSYPIITFHKNNEDLLTELYQIKLRPITYEDSPSEGGAAAKWPAGALTLTGLTDEALQQAFQDLSSQIGLDLATPEWSYALVRRTRLVGTATYKGFEAGVFGNPNPDSSLQPEAHDAIDNLVKGDTDIDICGAKGYLEFYETFEV
ncbi:uncharacterized protein [Amphiura filiformis]|uniref:uncharacterized protein n=1 Tax=Amphiura filiformis TaxID=82378 RepID=UPI003B211DA7